LTDKGGNRRGGVSVVVPAYDVAAYLEGALASAAAQTLRPVEIIVVDDGSTDGTPALLERLQASEATGDIPLVVLRQANAGPSAARNAGLRVARGAYVGFLDADDRWHPQKLARHVSVLDQQVSIDVTYSWFRRIDEAGRPTGFVGRPANQGFADLVRENGIVTSLVVARRDALLRAGGFDEALRSHVDFDLWLRVADQRAGSFHCIPEVLTDHRARPGQITADWRRMERNWERVIENARGLQPQVVAAVEREARARHGLFLARAAYRAGEVVEARRLLRRAWAAHPRVVAQAGQGWSVTAAVVLASAPARLRDPLFGTLRWWRARRAQAAPRIGAP
jgi:glycosyltransferase involved in cell wall biosynthesis